MNNYLFLPKIGLIHSVGQGVKIIGSQFNSCGSEVTKGSMVAYLGVHSLFLSFFLSFVSHSVLSSSPMSASIAQNGLRGFPLCASIPFLFLALILCLSSVLMGIPLINKIKVTNTKLPFHTYFNQSFYHCLYTWNSPYS